MSMAKFEKFDAQKHIHGLVEAARQMQIEDLIRDGKMPSFERVVAAINETRREYHARILAARQEKSRVQASPAARRDK
jgi:hypothetical protein